MRILIEGTYYNIDHLKDNIFLDSKFYESNSKGEAKIISVGYYRNKTGEIVYMLPKVFKNLSGIDDEKQLEPKIKHNDIQPWARKLTVYFHKGLEIYKKSASADENRSSKLKSKNGSQEYTYWELIESFNEFYLRNKNTILFRHIQHISNQVKKTNWSRTVRKSLPFIDNSKRPIYVKFDNKKKVVNYEEELITIFFSILNYFKNEHVLDIKIDKAYNIAKGKEFESLKRNGNAKLKKIKHRYYSDVMKQMFRLCEIYFKVTDTSTLKKGEPEFMAVNKYNTVFEAMLEKILVGPVDYDEQNKAGVTLKALKHNRDGKIIDHIYKDLSLISEEDYIYYIADAKYYSPEIIEENDEDNGGDTEEERNINKANTIHGVSKNSHSFYKQFTYAKNTIQLNVELFYKDDKENKIKVDKSKLEQVNYRDENTEGYNITPNFFIYGYTTTETLKDLKEPFISYNNTTEAEKNFEIIQQWPFRLFDRDTLFTIHYKMSFPYVLKAYISKNAEYLFRQKEKIRNEFRKLFIQIFREHSDYSFYTIGFINNSELLDFVNENFKKINGKCISVPFEKKLILILALHAKDLELKTFLEAKLMDISNYSFTFGNSLRANQLPNQQKNCF
ncbi:MAG: hypothetical protein FJX80_04820 [Bacteroidetes bacterium]|nr:hypothetical protein [Bacteroidota bacterium]